MEVTFQTLFNAALGFIMLIIGWLLRAAWGLIQDMQAEIKSNREKGSIEVYSLSTKVSDEYVRKDDLNNSMKRIEDMFKMIFEKLDDKVDK
jgi:hypothetical protein